MKQNAVLGKIHSIETFGSVDGPGIRFIVFLKGCAMRCRYCHNPDTWSAETTDLRTADQVLTQALRYRAYWGKQGGITVSGGEALLQIDFVTQLFSKAKSMGIHTCLDTSMQPFTRRKPFFTKFEELMRYTDLILLDIKHINAAQHQQLTGFTNDNILDCAQYLSAINKPVWIRHVLVPTITDNDKYLIALRQFIKTLKNVQRIEVLPYHALGVFKWKELGIPYTLENIEPPSKQRVQHAQDILEGKKEE